MANTIVFNKLTGADLEKALGKAKSFSAQQPKKAFAAADLRTNLKKFQSENAVTKAPELNAVKLSAVSITVKDIDGIRSIRESQTPTAEAIVGQKMSPEKVIGTLYSSFTALEFTKMESEFKTRMKAAKTNDAKKKVQSEWNNVVKAGIQVLDKAGLKNLNEDKLRGLATELSKNKANFNTIVTIANTGVAPKGAKPVILSAATVLAAGFLTETGAVIDPNIITTVISGLCSKPFAEGSFTKHFHKGFSLVVRIPYWCPTWTNPFRVCHKNVTLAGLSLDLDVQVGYKVTCCGATAFGQASAEVCATLVGIKFCAGCTAQITGVAGIGRTGSGNNCVYGLGINAKLQCKFGGITVLNVQAPFGFNVSGPCPPAGLCN